MSVLAPATPRLADRTADLSAGPARLLVLPTPTRDVVSFRGSFTTAPDLATGGDIVQGLVTDLLDKGTTHRDRFALADALDGRGARVSFYSDGLRVGVSGRALRDDLPDVLAIAAEMLLDPLFDEEEVEKAIAQAVASVRQSREATGAQAGGALARRLYGLAHPNYVYPADDEIARIEAVTADALRAYHAEHIGADDLTITLAGDVQPHTAQAVVGDVFARFAPLGRTAVFDAAADPEAPGRTVVPMADRPNLDVRLGHAVGLRRDSPDYLALYTGIFALGGNFSSRLMQTIRDQQGLTYGISARLSGVAVEHDADVRVSVGLGAETLERGIAATRAEIARFVAEGVDAATLRATQTTLTGQHVVAMATTGGLSTRLLVNAERGFDVGYLDRYSDLIRDLTPEVVTAAVRQHLQPEGLHETVAGTLL